MTGVAEGTIFYHFKNKEGLFLQILERIKEDLLGGFEQLPL
jgi:AcrR family transcriptional regulator